MMLFTVNVLTAVVRQGEVMCSCIEEVDHSYVSGHIDNCDFVLLAGGQLSQQIQLLNI